MDPIKAMLEKIIEAGGAPAGGTIVLSNPPEGSIRLEVGIHDARAARLLIIIRQIFPEFDREETRELLDAAHWMVSLIERMDTHDQIEP